ncbi:hypothetical protein DFH09DRAFT_1199880 [Mycena vulgaris]|nr:hypothetical protein DFH09DRAFT_1199880 [Mycena vulgaris]
MSAYLQRAQGRSAGTCGDSSDALPFYRLLAGTGEYLYGRRPNHGRIRSSRRAERVDLQTVAALVFATQEVSTVPFYTLHSNAGREFLYVADTTELANVLNNGYHLSTEPVGVYLSNPNLRKCSVLLLEQHGQKIQLLHRRGIRETRFYTNEGYTDVYIVGYVLPLWCSQCT